MEQEDSEEIWGQTPDTHGISALKPGQPIVDYTQFKKTKKKRNSH